MKITKREIIFFIAGILAMLLIESVYDWRGTKSAFRNGWNDGGTVLKR